MYQRDIPKLPKTITRDEFVNIVFDLGHRHQHGYDTIVASVQLGDYFVSFKGERNPFFLLSRAEKRSIKDLLKKNTQVKGAIYNLNTDILLNSPFREKLEQKPFMYELVPQIYSTELAYVVTVIMAKSNEDDGYRWTDDAVSDTNNRYVIKMEWEICMLLNFNIKVHNFITLIGHIICTTLNDDEKTHDLSTFKLHSMFFDLSKEICLNRDLLAKDAKVIVIGCILLNQAGKLRAQRTNKERTFREVMMKISREYEVDIGQLLQAYINIKSKNLENKQNQDIQNDKQKSLVKIPYFSSQNDITLNSAIPVHIIDVMKI